MRDTLKSAEYFKNFLDEESELLPQYKEAMNNGAFDYAKRLGFSYDFFRESCHAAVASYSAGAPISEVKQRAIEAIDALQSFVSMGEQDQDYFFYGEGGGYSGGFDMWYRLLAWCILFDLPRDKTDIVLDYLVLQMRNPRQATDAVVNKMVKALGCPGQDETDHLLWPEAYEPLCKCFKQEAYRQQQLETFIKAWYRKMADTYWYNNHKGGHDTYFGYWCFEAAAVAKMLDIDDSSLKDHPNYPYDARRAG